MEKAELIAAATAEIAQPTLSVTRQFLTIHAVAYEAGSPKVAGVDWHKEKKLGIVYFAVEKEKFYLAISLSAAQPGFQPAPQWMWAQEWNRIAFRAASEILTSQQLMALTTLKPTAGWEKGSQRKGAGAKHNYSSIEFVPHPEPGEFGVMLKKLLDFLAQDAEGVRALVDKAAGYVQITSVFHNGNTTLSGLHLDKECIQRLATLNLEIDFDLYAEGNFYR
jgi:hypothetical protein